MKLATEVGQKQMTDVDLHGQGLIAISIPVAGGEDLGSTYDQL